jgi:hypothetical protein
VSFIASPSSAFAHLLTAFRFRSTSSNCHAQNARDSAMSAPRLAPLTCFHLPSSSNLLTILELLQDGPLEDAGVVPEDVYQQDEGLLC